MSLLERIKENERQQWEELSAAGRVLYLISLFVALLALIILAASLHKGNHVWTAIAILAISRLLGIMAKKCTR